MPINLYSAMCMLHGYTKPNATNLVMCDVRCEMKHGKFMTIWNGKSSSRKHNVDYDDLISANFEVHQKLYAYSITG